MATTEISEPIFIQIGRKRYQVASYAEASRMFCKARDESGLGASQIATPHITDEHGNPIAYVAYNGRVFAGAAKNWKAGTPILFDPLTSPEARWV